MVFRVAPSTLTGVLALLMVKHLLDGVLLHDLSMEEWISVWSCHHHRGSSRFLRCQNSLQQYRGNDSYDRSIVLSRAPWPVMRIRVFITTPNMQLVSAWAGSKPARMSSWHLRVTGRCKAYSIGYGFPCDMCTATPGTWGMNVPIMPPHLDHSALCPVITLKHGGFVITLMPPLVLVLATTLAKYWKNGVTLEPKQQRCLKTGFSAVSVTVSSMISTHAVHHTLSALIPFFPMRSPFAAPWCTSSEPWKAQLRVFLPLRVPVKVSHTTCGILYWSCYYTSRLPVPSNLSSMKLTLR